MSRAVKSLATVFQFGYGLMLLGVGAVGIFTARWELASVFGVPADATFFNQYRFLKSLEFALGLFCLGYRQRILRGGSEAWLFLTLVGVGVFARALSWGVDGQPRPVFVGFILLEAATFLLVAGHLFLGRHAHAG